MGWAAQVFFPAVENTSHLANLHAHFDENGEAEEFVDVSNPAILNILAKLSLRTFNLQDGLFCNYVDFTSIFPALTSLQLSSQSVSLGMLSSFAPIPKLEHMVVGYCSSNSPPPLQDSTPDCLSLHTLEIVGMGNFSLSPKRTNLIAA